MTLGGRYEIVVRYAEGLLARYTEPLARVNARRRRFQRAAFRFRDNDDVFALRLALSHALKIRQGRHVVVVPTVPLTMFCQA